MSGTTSKSGTRSKKESRLRSGSVKKIFQSDQSCYTVTNSSKLSSQHALLEQNYKDMYEKTPCMLCSTTIDGIIFACNEFYAERLGYSKNEVMGKSAFDFVATQSIEEYENSFQMWKNTGSVSNATIWFKRRGDSEFLGLINSTNLYDVDEKLIGSNTTIRDITDLYEVQKTVEVNEKKLKQQNEALKIAYDHLLETEQKYRTLYEKSSDLLRTVDLAGNIVDCNDSYCSSLGYSREEIMGKSMYVHVAEKSIDDLKNAILEWNTTGSIGKREIWLQR
ncbi:MAG: PAS domain-containing protein, partial [Nitrosotalea sp.]